MPTLQEATTIDYSQMQLTSKLNKYLAFKNSVRPVDEPEYVLPYDISNYMCGGLTAYWLYYSRIKDEVELYTNELDFNNTLQYILDWDPENMGPGITSDPILEEFINFVAFFNFDTELRDKPEPDSLGIKYPIIRQHDLDKSFALIQAANDYYPAIAAPEFKITFVFNEETLSNILNIIANEFKMFKLSNNFHAMGLIKISDQYHFYDPNQSAGIVVYNDTLELAIAIITAFSVYNNAADSMAIDITVFDLITAEPATYIDPVNYYHESLRDNNIKDMVLKNQYLFELCLWGRNYTLLNILINEGLDLNQITHNGKTLLYITIEEGNIEILYALLNAGADPNVACAIDYTTLKLSCYKKNMEAIIMLLAFGYDLSDIEFRLLKINFSAHEILDIARKAVELNKVILEIAHPLQINYSDSTKVINYLHHCKLKKQLADYLKSNHITPFDRDKFYGKHMLETLWHIEPLIKYYKDKNNSDLIDYAAKAELYKLLKFLKPKNKTFKGSRDLIEFFPRITRQILATACTDYTKNDLLNIKMILEQLEDICVNTKKTCYIKRCLVAKATKATTKINNHLEGLNNLQHQPSYLFFASGKDHHKSQVSYATAMKLLHRG